MSKTVAKALSALELVRGGSRSLSELADHLGTHASTAMRLLQPVVDAGLLARGADGRYRLGLRLVELGQDAMETLDLRAAAHPYLVELAAQTRCTIHLAQLLDDAIVYADKVEAPGGVRMWSRVGRQVPLHTAAASKAILAGLPPEQRVDLLRGWEFTPYTPRTVADVSELELQLSEVAECGFARDDAEFEPLVHCIGVPLRIPGELAPAAISATAVRERPSDAEVAELVERLRATVTAIQRELGKT
ncbi:IclR family transcriptional regulator [Tamaricihabitans halophyticus]|uniref:IclR family transcriptional regulator n=1 Tax=Tamaricihabitans halophyticus TaxID=1262583 RepID=A0A4R2R1J5_9PSEU|nr:IclR family transcriptional regulator [Tamaricihabitans halophyticus]TCP56373.1 IclR family transcriptional regulator [Tamaricihabitans halophyticus]